ncbi:hypothetical protein Q7P36_007737, partial [Cladosporium allicinum]
MAAIGDSYSAGIGAGNRLDEGDDRLCSRYDHSYPYLLNQDGWLGDASARTFQFVSCSGAVTKDVLETQIPRIDGNQEIILLSAGGNDVELTNILNQCVFQWLALRPEAVSVAKKLASVLLPSHSDWDVYTRSCEEQLSQTSLLIDKASFQESIDKVGTIYYTGYAKFFAEDLSSDCDDVSWATWSYQTETLFQAKQYLTSLHRRTMNELVDAVNARISDAVKRAGSGVKFINYDDGVGSAGGRFCESGVDESIKASNT